MKKVSCFLVLFLLLLTMSPLQASTKSDENEFFADLNVIASNNPEVIQAFTFYSASDKITYLVEIYEDGRKIYNDDTKELIVTTREVTTYDAVPTVFHNKLLSKASNNIDNYESWSDYVYVRETSSYIDKIESHTISTIVGIIAYPAGGWSVPIGLLSGIAIEMYNSNTSHYTVKHYNKWNKFCGILVINKYNYHAGSKKIGEVVQNTTWLSTPYDYTQPAACRILADRY